MNKEGLAHICVHPHIALSSVPCSTSFPHTKLPYTYCVYFHPQLYILFSVLSNYSGGSLIVRIGWLSARKVPLLLLRSGSSTWGAASTGPGYDADKDKLNRRKRRYSFMTVPILARWGKKMERQKTWEVEADSLIKPGPHSRVDLLISRDLLFFFFFLDAKKKSDGICS